MRLISTSLLNPVWRQRNLGRQTASRFRGYPAGASPDGSRIEVGDVEQHVILIDTTTATFLDLGRHGPGNVLNRGGAEFGADCCQDRISLGTIFPIDPDLDELMSLKGVVDFL